MVVHPTKLPGVAIVEAEPLVDERDAFARTFDHDTFLAHSLDARVAQCNISRDPRAGTVRGLHYQAAPHGEGKLVRCTRGRVFDVVVDLRVDSASHREWIGIELVGDGALSLYLPEGCAHGFQTLLADSQIHYQMMVPHVPGAYRGVRWDDPAFAIEWPEPDGDERVISDCDRGYSDYLA